MCLKQWPNMVSRIMKQLSWLNLCRKTGPETCRNICIWSNYQIWLARSLIFFLFEQITKYDKLIGLPLHLNIQLPWVHWTPSSVQYSTAVSWSNTLRSSIFNSSKLNGHPPQYSIQLTLSSMDTLWDSIFNSGELIGHPSKYNIPLQLAHIAPSGVQYSSLVSSIDTLWNSIFNSCELNGHLPEYNIQLTMSSMDTLWGSIFNSDKLSRHPPEYNIQLQ